VLAETDRLFTCGYCRVRLYLLPQKFFRYRLPLASPARKDLVYFPYWRFKGILFSAGPAGVAHRVIDISRQACPNPAFPVSLGFRPQALRLRFVLPETPGYFVQPSLPLEKAAEVFTAPRGRRPPALQAQIGESVSLIYAPFYIGKKLIDGVLDRTLGGILPESLHKGGLAGGPPHGRIDFISAVCPQCGWDLSGARASAVLNCRHCRTVWQPTAAGLRNIGCAHAAGAAGSRYLPFWRIRTVIQGLDDRLADTLRTGNPLLRGPSDGGRQQRLRFWVPAFKLRPKSFLRLAGQLTFSPPRHGLLPEAPAEACYPVTLPVSEAVESLPIHLANRLASPPGQTPWPLGLKVSAASCLLVYLPFDETAHELVLKSHPLAINRNALALAEAL
jgi:hypothetical protein